MSLALDGDLYGDVAAATATREALAQFERLVEHDGNDAGNAEFFASRIRGEFVYVGKWRAWLEFDGKRWLVDKTGEITRRAKGVRNEMLELALASTSGVVNEKFVKYAVRCGDKRKIDAMIELAQSELPAAPEQFDRDPLKFNVANGTLDLTNGRLRPHNSGDWLMKLSPVAYDEAADAPRWERFLDEIFLGRRDLIDYAQRLIGYALTGDVREHILPIAYGTGANGKSVFVRTIMSALGDYAAHTDVSLFLARRDHGATPDVARLKGARFVAASELPEGGKLAENLVKSLTGGDRITARHLYGEPFEFEPTAKFWISTNYKPIVRGDDNGIWRRLRLIPFEARFEGDARDPRLAEALEGELSGILRWAVTGCQRWLEQGLGDARPVVTATAEYRDESDAIAAFLADRCLVRDDCEARASALSAEYARWCDTGNEHALSARKFRAKIRERGFDERKSNGDVVFLGLGLLANGGEG